MDIGLLDTRKGAEQGFEVVLTNPRTGEPTDVVITVLGADSGEYQAAANDLQRQRLNQMAKTRRMTQTPEMLQADAIGLLVAVTRGWRGLQMDGKELPFSAENANTIYTRFAWIREQIDQAVHDRANFLPRAATRS